FLNLRDNAADLRAPDENLAALGKSHIHEPRTASPRWLWDVNAMHLNAINVFNRMPLLPPSRDHVHAVPEFHKPARDVAAVAADAAQAGWRGKLRGDQA